MPTDQPAPPNPGSDAAIAIGCRGPVLDNAHGPGIQYRGETLFYISETCPVHGANRATDREIHAAGAKEHGHE